MRNPGRRSWCTALILAAATSGAARESSGEQPEIGIIDFYGLGRVSERAAREALTFKEGDAISAASDEPPAFLAESERRLSRLAGVARATTILVCCEADRYIVYVGVEEQGRAPTTFRHAPRGTDRLSPDVRQAGQDFDRAWMEAVRRGDVEEDDSQGHSLVQDPATRAVQDRFAAFARRDRRNLRRVLRGSSDAEQRALAAWILGYVADKQSVVDDLLYAMSDPSSDVRNNATRALGLFARMSASAGHPMVRIPGKPFVALLHSLDWTDRNKASLALLGLTARRDPALLERLRREAEAPLVDMARWKSLGHAWAALMILGRIGGQSDEALEAALNRGDREAIIHAALDRPRAAGPR